MRRVTPVVLAAAALLLLLDIIGALTAKPLGLPYSPFGVVSLVIYLGVSAIAAWRTSFGIGLFAAALVGFIDGTIGPLLAWMIGPGPVGQSVTEPRIFAYGIAVGTGIAAVAGLVGAAVGSWIGRRRGLRESRVVQR